MKNLYFVLVAQFMVIPLTNVNARPPGERPAEPPREPAPSPPSDSAQLRETAFLLAAARGQTEEAERLLGLGVDINTRFPRETGPTALHFAAHGGHQGTVEMLLGRGAPIDANGDINGLTPLVYARLSNKPAIEALLLNRGANPDYLQSLNSTRVAPSMRF